LIDGDDGIVHDDNSKTRIVGSETSSPSEETETENNDDER